MPWGDNQKGDGPWGQKPEGKTGKKGKKSKKNSPPEDIGLEEILQKGQDKIKELFPNGGGKKGGDVNKKSAIVLLALAAGILWLATGIFTVNTREEAIVLRFGEYVRTAGPGLNYHLPRPFERVVKLRVTDRYKEEIGYRSGPSKFQGSSREILILTGDENIVDINFEVQWQISDAKKFLFNVHDPQRTIRNAAESAMREVIGTTPINEILSEGRTVAQLQTKEALQEILDSYDIGVRIEEINMKGDPPSTVVDAFKDVQAAKINKQETINKSMAYRNEVIPIARGEAQEMIQKAEGYKEQVIANAEGEASRFIQIHDKYKKAKFVTKKRMYLETMEEVLAGMDKMIIDSKSSSSMVPYLPLNELKKKGGQ